MSEHDKTDLVWWLNNGSKRCGFCGRPYDRQAESHCYRCERPVCPFCVVIAHDTWRTLCPDCQAIDRYLRGRRHGEGRHGCDAPPPPNHAEEAEEEEEEEEE